MARLICWLFGHREYVVTSEGRGEDYAAWAVWYCSRCRRAVMEQKGTEKAVVL